MSRSYSASTRKHLWRLVMATARLSLPGYVGTDGHVGRAVGEPGEPCRFVSISGLPVAHHGTRRSIRPDTCLHSFKN